MSPPKFQFSPKIRDLLFWNLCILLEMSLSSSILVTVDPGRLSKRSALLGLTSAGRLKIEMPVVPPFVKILRKEFKDSTKPGQDFIIFETTTIDSDIDQNVTTSTTQAPKLPKLEYGDLEQGFEYPANDEFQEYVEYYVLETNNDTSTSTTIPPTVLPQDPQVFTPSSDQNDSQIPQLPETDETTTTEPAITSDFQNTTMEPNIVSDFQNTTMEPNIVSDFQNTTPEPIIVPDFQNSTTVPTTADTSQIVDPETTVNLDQESSTDPAPTIDSHVDVDIGNTTEEPDSTDDNDYEAFPTERLEEAEVNDTTSTENPLHPPDFDYDAKQNETTWTYDTVIPKTNDESENSGEIELDGEEQKEDEENSTLNSTSTTNITAVETATPRSPKLLFDLTDTISDSTSEIPTNITIPIIQTTSDSVEENIDPTPPTPPTIMVPPEPPSSGTEKDWAPPIDPPSQETSPMGGFFSTIVNMARGKAKLINATFTQLASVLLGLPQNQRRDTTHFQ